MRSSDQKNQKNWQSESTRRYDGGGPNGGHLGSDFNVSAGGSGTNAPRPDRRILGIATPHAGDEGRRYINW